MKGNFIFFDFETDGLDPETSVPTELAMIAYSIDQQKELARFSTYIQPPEGHEIDMSVLSKTDVTIGDIHSGVPQKEVLKMMDKFVRANTPKGKLTRTSKPTLCGHNVGFDLARIRKMHSDANKDPFKLFASNSGEFTSVCTLQLSRIVLEYTDSEYDGGYSLGALCSHFGIPLFNAHGAMADTVATMKIFEILRTDASKTQTENSDFTEKPKVKKRANFQI